MTVVLPPPAPTRPPLDRGRLRLVAACSIVALAVVAAAVALVVSDRRYGPVTGGNFGGIVSAGAFSAGSSGDYRLTATRGQVMEALYNNGSHAITITSMSSQREVSQIRWSPFTIVGGGTLGPQGAQWQDFPAVIPAHGVIRLLVTVHKPANCPPQSEHVAVPYRPVHEVRWKSLLWSHSTSLRDVMVTIDLC